MKSIKILTKTNRSVPVFAIMRIVRKRTQSKDYGEFSKRLQIEVFLSGNKNKQNV
jgi:hypothetical protein